MAAADWLAADLSPSGSGALSLLTDPTTPVDVLRAAKEAFKIMRVMGEQVADRRLGARLYLGAIASALAYHGARITSQSDDALVSALREMRDDDGVHESLRHLATVALRSVDPRPSGRAR